MLHLLMAFALALEPDPGPDWRERYPLIQSANFRRDVSTDVLRGRVYIHDRERDPMTLEWYERTYEYGISYRFVRCVPRTANEFYIYGKGLSDGSDLIERWTVPRKRGGYFAQRPASTEPLGVPVTTPTTTIDIFVPPFVPPAQRDAPVPGRKLVYRGSHTQGIEGLVVDPDGRFLLFVGKLPRALYRVTLNPVAAAQVPLSLQTPAEIPALTGPTDYLSAANHEVLHRAFRIPDPTLDGSGYLTLLIDDENDGLIDSVQIHSSASYAASGIAGGWLENYISY